MPYILRRLIAFGAIATAISEVSAVAKPGSEVPSASPSWRGGSSTCDATIAMEPLGVAAETGGVSSSYEEAHVHHHPGSHGEKDEADNDAACDIR